MTQKRGRTSDGRVIALLPQGNKFACIVECKDSGTQMLKKLLKIRYVFFLLNNCEQF